MTPAELLETWISARADAAAMDWFQDRLAKSSASNTDRDLAVTFGMIPRKFGRADLNLSDAELAAADAARPGWNPKDWTVDQAARVLLLLKIGGEGDAFAKRLADLAQFAEIGEAIALYRGLPLYPNPELLVPIAREGCRTNMLGVFEAVAHNNPFPKEMFDEAAWNQMVVKAIFVGSFLAPVQGIDERANRELAIVFTDTSKERRAAGRTISFEVWRCIGPCADDDMVAEMTRELTGRDPLGRQGAALGLASAPVASGPAALRERAPDLAAGIDSGDLSWASLSENARRGLQQHFERT